MTPEQRNYISVTGTSTVYKEDYFNTMFYRAYVGTPAQQDASGNYQNPSQQIPCYAMRHFVPVYVSPYPYYGQGRSAVIIAKYYEGAFFNGTISCNNTPLPYVSVAILDEYGFPHDYLFTDENGSFNLLSPGGNITLLFSYSNEVLLKQITFNNTNNTLYSPVTDAEAMRLNGSRYSRNFNISVNLSTLEGFVYQDDNNNGSYDPTVDTPLSGITIELNDYYFGRPVQPVKTDLQGHYLFRNLYSSKYNISAVDEDDFTLINREPINIEPGDISYNISKPRSAEIKGIVYIDSNGNTEYTSGEEANDVQIQLNYIKLDGTQKSVTNITTGTAGTYSFLSLIPGEYTLNATKQSTSTGNLVYLTEQTVTLTTNKTSWVNISLAYAPVLVSGYTANNTIKIASIPVTFIPDNSVKNNTAIQITATSDVQGFYAAKLTPGTYNVTVQKTETGTTVYIYTGKLIVSIGEGKASYNIELTKVSVTVSGNTTYNGVGKGNITILFSKDLQNASNTAVSKSVKSDSNGSYAIELTPGSYNVSVAEVVNESGQNITYTGAAGQIILNIGDAPRVLNILLTREQSP